MEIVPLLMRWLHVLSAIVAVGGAFFMLAVLRPSANAVLPEAQHDALRGAVRGRWQRVVHITILLFLISGFYNYLVLMRPQHVDQPLYHALFGIKFLLALAVFTLAIALTSSKDWSARMRSNSGTWLGLLVALAVTVVLISGAMRALPKSLTPQPPTVETADTTTP